MLTLQLYVCLQNHHQCLRPEMLKDSIYAYYRNYDKQSAYTHLAFKTSYLQ